MVEAKIHCVFDMPNYPMAAVYESATITVTSRFQLHPIPPSLKKNKNKEVKLRDCRRKMQMEIMILKFELKRDEKQLIVRKTRTTTTHCIKDMELNWQKVRGSRRQKKQQQQQQQQKRREKKTDEKPALFQNLAL